MNDKRPRKPLYNGEIYCFVLRCLLLSVKGPQTRYKWWRLASLQSRSQSARRKCTGYDVCTAVASRTFVLNVFDFDTYASSYTGNGGRNASRFLCKLFVIILISNFLKVKCLTNFIKLGMSTLLNMAIHVFWGCYALLIGKWIPTFRRGLLLPSSGSSNPLCVNWQISSRHSVICHRTCIFISMALRISNLTSITLLNSGLWPSAIWFNYTKKFWVTCNFVSVCIRSACVYKRTLYQTAWEGTKDVYFFPIPRWNSIS
jgi:hypothetical protein